MDKPSYVYHVKQPMPGYSLDQLAAGTGYHTVARALTPEGAGEVVRMLCAHGANECDHIRVEIRRES